MKINSIIKNNIQMSENFITMAFLTFSGGVQDAYSYFVRGKVFANAQTGNMVLMGEHFLSLEWIEGLKYLAPIVAFAVGIFISEQIENKYKKLNKIHWRQIIVLLEVVLLFTVGFLPHELNMLANVIVSLSCAMQVQSFRKINGFPFASTMCIGNLKSGVASFSKYTHTKSKEQLIKTLYYFGIIIIFTFGAGIGGVLSPKLDLKLIWLSCLFLVIGLILMFKDNNKERKR